MTGINNPFLKWAGGKRYHIPILRTYLPKAKRLIEPFAGAASVFLNTDYQSYVLGEANPDVIDVYLHIKESGSAFIAEVKSYLVPENNCPARYYELRDLFNTSSDRRLRSVLFVYLNRYGFNGLCRYNSRRQFNVPFGAYVKVYVPEQEILFFSEKAKNAKFVVQDFRKTLAIARKGDVVYCDPPYVPLSATACFTGYNGEPFTEAQQWALAEQAQILAARGIPVVISNHDTPLTRQMYRAAKIITFDVRRNISCQSYNRKRARELLAVFS